MSNRLFTIGYEGTAVADFLTTLRKAGVQWLVDVRDAPVSRRPGFSKAALADALESAGIGYMHLKGLGNPKEGRDAARAGEREHYLAILNARLDGPDGETDLARAAATAREGPACLMCYERDPRQCHRAIVAERLSQTTDLQIQHLRVQHGIAAEAARIPDMFAPPETGSGPDSTGA